MVKGHKYKLRLLWLVDAWVTWLCRLVLTIRLRWARLSSWTFSSDTMFPLLLHMFSLCLTSCLVSMESSTARLAFLTLLSSNMKASWSFMVSSSNSTTGSEKTMNSQPAKEEQVHTAAVGSVRVFHRKAADRGEQAGCGRKVFKITIWRVKPEERTMSRVCPLKKGGLHSRYSKSRGATRPVQLTLWEDGGSNTK